VCHIPQCLQRYTFGAILLPSFMAMAIERWPALMAFFLVL
jgi:hypothetical protein